MAHPLTLLRAAKGLSHPEYARLVAQAHSELGLGQMAARREKVSRWESGRTVPEHSAQLAMAHLHGVPAREVCRLGWPHWLHLVTSDTILLDQPCTATGAELALHSALHLPKAPRSPALLLKGAALAVQLRSAIGQMTVGGRTRRSRPDGCSSVASVASIAEQLRWIEVRVAALERHEYGTTVPVAALYPAAHAEHRLVVRLLGVGGHGAPASRRLFRLAARTALLCSWLSSALGEETRAERHNLTAVRAAAAAGEPAVAAVAMTQLALRHIIAGDPADGLTLVRAARAAHSRSAPGAATLLHNVEALALAGTGNAVGAARALDRAAESVALASCTGTGTGTGTDPDAPPYDADAHERSVTVARAQVSLFLDAPHKARWQFENLTDSLLAPHAAVPSPHTGVWLLYVADAHLALGEIGPAVRTVHQAVDVAGTLPPGLALRYRERLARHAHEPAVRQVLERLDDPLSGPPSGSPTGPPPRPPSEAT
ncbi:hypothetical protein ACFVXG_02650 [Kitasatospora sp. NPDC058162]|uniref:hypothetical protein n=1 Tax=Kitasatospora sp. NPDC058162 TaxID=3346362 RepID=UPI0036D9F51C